MGLFDFLGGGEGGGFEASKLLGPGLLNGGSFSDMMANPMLPIALKMMSNNVPRVGNPINTFEGVGEMLEKSGNKAQEQKALEQALLSYGLTPEQARAGARNPAAAKVFLAQRSEQRQDKILSGVGSERENLRRKYLDGGAPPASMGPRSDAGDATGDFDSQLGQLKQGIRKVESSGGNYAAVGPAVRRKDGSIDHAYGADQVMGANIPSWTEKHYGQRLTPQEFLQNAEAQEAVFNGEMGGYLKKFGNVNDAASMWFSGKPYAGNNASDGYLKVPQYVAKVNAGMGGPPRNQVADASGTSAPSAPAVAETEADVQRLEREMTPPPPQQQAQRPGQLANGGDMPPAPGWQTNTSQNPLVPQRGPSAPQAAPPRPVLTPPAPMARPGIQPPQADAAVQPAGGPARQPAAPAPITPEQAQADPVAAARAITARPPEQLPPPERVVESAKQVTARAAQQEQKTGRQPSPEQAYEYASALIDMGVKYERAGIKIADNLKPEIDYWLARAKPTEIETNMAALDRMSPEKRGEARAMLPDSTPSPQKMADAELRARGYEPNTTTYKSLFPPTLEKYAKAGASTNTNINEAPKTESKYDLDMAGYWAKQNQELMEASTKANSKIGQYQRMQSALKNPNVTTGAGGELTLLAKQIAKAAGFNVEGVPETELVSSVSKQLALEIRNPSNGAGMPGAMSDGDRKFLAAIPPGLSTTKGGNALIADFAIRQERRNIEVNDLRRDYVKKNKRLDEGFHEVLHEWSKANPLFDPKVDQKLVDEAMASGNLEPGEDISKDMPRLEKNATGDALYKRMKPGTRYLHYDGKIKTKPETE
jgi:hypothetical protein